MKRFVSATCILFLAASLLCSCVDNNSFSEKDSSVRNAAGLQANDDGVLNLCIYQADTLNPLKTSVKHNAEVLSLLYDGLFTAQSDFSAVANLAESFSVSPDGLTVTVQIRKNVKFSNGTVLNAADAAASVNTIVNSDGYYSSRLSMLKSAAAKGNFVEIYLKKPTANLTVLLDFPILPNGGAEEIETNSILSSVIPGSGIYELSEYHLNKEILLQANHNHHSGVVPYIETIIIHMAANRETAVSMLENSRIDMLTGYAADIEAHTPENKLTDITYNGCRFIFLGMNTKKKEMNTSKVRNAVFAAVNCADIVSVCNLNAVASSLPIHPNAYLANLKTDPYETDLSTGDRLLTAEDRTDIERNGIFDKTVHNQRQESSFELLINADNPAKAPIAKLLRKALSSIGIKVEICSVPFADYQSKIASDDYELFLGETDLLPNFDFNDILTLSDINQADEKLLLDAVKNAQLTADFITQKENYAQILSLYHAWQPLVGICFKNEVFLCDERIKAENITTLNPYQSIYTWSIAN